MTCVRCDCCNISKYSAEYKQDTSQVTFLNMGIRWKTEYMYYEIFKEYPVLQSSIAVKFPSEEIDRKQTLEKGSFLHLFAGGLAGCASAFVTCPIDVIKTRQQSSGKIASYDLARSAKQHAPTANTFRNLSLHRKPTLRVHYTRAARSALLSENSILQHTRYLLHVEGFRSFYKGLGPTLMGVVPSRALFFFAYDTAKSFLNRNLHLRKNAIQNDIIASIFGGLTCTTATCPLWVLKTKQQLHRRLNQTSLSAMECIRQIWKKEGVKGFYRGLTASYAGILETAIYFTIYQQLKTLYISKHNLDPAGCDKLSMSSFWELPGLMLLSSSAKCTATCIAYPHEVVRTRLREEPVKLKYNGFFQTLKFIFTKEGFRGLYGGLPAQLVRQVPNMAIIMGVYETVIFLARN